MLPAIWRAMSGLWRRLIVPSLAHRIHSAHREVFGTLGYECDPDPTP